MPIESLLQEIKDLASWHCDLDADESDTSPGDMTAHVNGLIVRKIDAYLAKGDDDGD